MGDARRARTNPVTPVNVLRGVELMLVLFVLPVLVLAQPVGSVRGFVHDSLGGVVSSAHLSIRGSGTATISDSAGAFRLTGLAPGEAVLEVRRLGYRPVSTPVTIAAGRELGVDVELAPVPEQLAPVQVFR